MDVDWSGEAGARQAGARHASARWYYSVQYTQITLCGDACDSFKALPTPTADVEFFCEGGG